VFGWDGWCTGYPVQVHRKCPSSMGLASRSAFCQESPTSVQHQPRPTSTPRDRTFYWTSESNREVGCHGFGGLTSICPEAAWCWWGRGRRRRGRHVRRDVQARHIITGHPSNVLSIVVPVFLSRAFDGVAQTRPGRRTIRCSSWPGSDKLSILSFSSSIQSRPMLSPLY